MANTKIMLCSCIHEFQDKKYGKGRRLHNKIKSGNNDEKFRCTVCLKER